jgi:glutamate-1-semialdehyde 2,1-aminomutase
LYFREGRGARLTDIDGNSYLDYALAWGPLILGHCHPAIVSAVRHALDRGATYGAQHDLEYEVAELIQSMVPCAERVCFANSGTEIVQVALRLARAVTGRSRFLKFEGHYHGWDDSVLVSYRSTIDQLDAANPDAVPTGHGQRPAHEALVARWNNRESVEAVFQQYGKTVAAVICEPLLCNSGCIEPHDGFLEFLRDISRANGALLIFDEVITGFRLARGGAQEHYGVTPDLATFAKALGGGLPVSALAGKAEHMEWIADGRVVHAGTLNGNPLSLAAASATLRTLNTENVFAGLWRLGELLRAGIVSILREKGFTVESAGGGPVFQISFQKQPSREYRDILAADKAFYSDFGMALLDEGVLVLPDGRWYLSTAHSDADIAFTLDAVRRAVTD